MTRAPLPDPRSATDADIAEAQRRYDLTFNALVHADYLSPVAAYQRQLDRLRQWLADAKAARASRPKAIKPQSLTQERYVAAWHVKRALRWAVLACVVLAPAARADCWMRPIPGGGGDALGRAYCAKAGADACPMGWEVLDPDYGAIDLLPIDHGAGTAMQNRITGIRLDHDTPFRMPHCKLLPDGTDRTN